MVDSILLLLGSWCGLTRGLPRLKVHMLQFHVRKPPRVTVHFSAFMDVLGVLLDESGY